MFDFKNMVVYQIWPRSFKDSNGDGIGDLGGVIEKLPYIKQLGVDLIWLSPIYPTHNHDYGYDIDDYCDVNPEYGTLEDFDRLVSEAKALGIGIVMDLVVNHTSSHHKWFEAAINDPNSKYRDYYIFKEGRPAKSLRGGKLPVTTGTIPPNNWMSAFGGSAWQKDENSGEYYLTLFTPNQCDLNWKNPEVREEVWKIMKFWLERGISGFRLDVINVIAKAEGLPDAGNPSKLDFPFEHIVSLPKTHEYLKEMNEKVLSKYDCFTVGEGMVTPLDAVIGYTGPDANELNMMFQFDLALIGCGPLGKYDFRKLYHWTIGEYKDIFDRWQSGIMEQGGWMGNYISNHDQPRPVSRFGNDRALRRESAKALALINMTMYGTPFIYQGEEIGMTNCLLEPDEWKDFEAINDYEMLKSMMHVPGPVAKKIVQKMTRDNARTVMQWTGGKNAGFTEGDSTWIKVNPNHTEINVEDDLKNSASVLDFYRQIIRLRHMNDELNYGSYRMIAKSNKKVIAYIRENEDRKLLIVVNMSDMPAKIDLGEMPYRKGHCILSTHKDAKYTRLMELEPFEGRVYRVGTVLK